MNIPTIEEQATSYLESILKPLSRWPEEVYVAHYMDSSGRGIVMNVTANNEDLKLLIGKKGLTARCVRDLMRCWCQVHSARILLHIGVPVRNI